MLVNKLKKFKMKKFHHLLVALFYLFQLGSCEENLFIPRQLHCLSEVVYREQELKLENYVVDEYVDIPNDRSSVKLFDTEKSTTNIYYHQINPPEQPTKRKFIVYDADHETCQFYQSRDWPLNKIRKSVVQMLPMSKLSRELCDLILGPSALLFVVEASKADFQFLRRDFDEQRLLDVDLYERVVDKDPDLVIKGLVMVVQVQVVAQLSLDARRLSGKTLANYKGNQPEFVSITVCSVSLKRVRSSGEPCINDELVISVQYHIVTNMLTGSLVGRELDETDGFDFSRDPFMQSVGIGCWKDVAYMGQKRFNAQSEQFSALYMTTLGSPGVSYVAYDGRRGLLRMDREGRKSIYDLGSRTSYHHAEFVSLEQFKDGQMKHEKEKSCVVMNLDWMGKIRPEMGIEQLLGIGLGNKANAIHLGSKMVDHVNYEVYELELFDSYPVIMETEGLSAFVPGTRYFMTYYVEEHVVRRPGDVDGPPIILPKMIELHELHKDMEKVLINRLDFMEFGWSLEVEPSDDPDGLKSLFYIEECAQARSQQVELRVSIKQDPKNTIPKRMEPTFRQQKQLVKYTVQARLVNLLNLSGLNVAHFDIKFPSKDSVDMLVEARFVELMDGLVKETKLGNAYFFDVAPNWKKSFISFKFNRHSLDECKLDSLMESSRNYLMYCPSTTACVLVQPETVESTKADLFWDTKQETSATKADNKIKCQVYSFKWAPKLTTENPLFDRINRNLFELIRREFQIDFEHRERPQAAPEFGKFVGFSGQPRATSLDGFSSDESALLAGLRHTVTEGLNANLAIEMRRQADISAKFDPLMYCQQACQMDSHCQSFSICLRGRKEALRADDCVLSTLRLTPRLVENMATDKLRESNKMGGEARLGLSDGTQRFRLQSQDGCSLHPKDFVSAYKLVKELKLKPKYLEAENKGTSLLSLDECAAKSHEESLFEVGRLSNFTYCPLSLSCLPDSLGSVAGASLDEAQPCYIYQRTFAQFYQRLPQTHLALVLPGQTTNTMAHLQQEHKDDGLTLALPGADRERCARLCLMRSSQCLSFDTCKMVSGGEICLQYPIRSPGAEIDRRLGLLPKEVQFYGYNEDVTKSPQTPTSGVGMNETNNNNDNDNSKERSRALIVGNQHCSHHRLWPNYANIRVAQLLAQLGKQQQHGGGEFEKPTGDGDKIDEMEGQILEEMISAKDGATAKAEAATGAGEIVPRDNQHHWFSFLFGLLLACSGLIYSQQVAACAGDLWQGWQAKRAARNLGPRISQLALANVDELDNRR